MFREPQNSEQSLVSRMLSYDGFLTSCFTIDYSDFDLLSDAFKEHSADIENSNPFVYGAYIASEHARSKEQARNAAKYLHAILDDIIDMNLSERNKAELL